MSAYPSPLQLVGRPGLTDDTNRPRPFLLPRVQAMAAPGFPALGFQQVRDRIADGAGRPVLVERPRQDVAADVRRRKGPCSLRVVRAQGTEAAELFAPAVLSSAPPAAVPVEQPAASAGVDFGFYRPYTEALLRRYIRLSLEGGRTPSLLGRELFLDGMTSGTVKTFADTSIFCIDVERCLAALSAGERHLVRRIALEEYTHEEAAALLRMNRYAVLRRYMQALDALTGMLLERGLLGPGGITPV